jgi:hypothetical protein
MVVGGPAPLRNPEALTGTTVFAWLRKVKERGRYILVRAIDFEPLVCRL